MAKKMLQIRHRGNPKSDGSFGDVQGEWTDEGEFSFNKYDEISSAGSKFLRSIDRDRYEIRWVPVTKKSKVSEAATLEVNSEQEGCVANTVFTADDLVGLAMLLKNAGIESAQFNGPATLTAGENIDDQNSITTTIQAPNLRAIMNMLEPEFQALGDLEAGVDDMVVGMDDQMIDPVLGESVDLNSKIKWPSTAWDFAILCGKTVATLEGNPDDYDAVEFQDYAEDIYREYPKKKPNWTVKDLLKDLGSNGYGVPSISDDGSKMSFHSADQWMAAAKKAGYTFGSDGYGSRDAFNKNHEKVGEWTGQYGNISTANSGWLVLKSSKNEQVEHDVHPTEYTGIADRKPVQPKTKMVPARSGDNPLEEATETSPVAQVFAAVPAHAFAQTFGEMIGNIVGAQTAGYGLSSIASWPEDTLNLTYKTPVDKALCDAAEKEIINFFTSLGKKRDPQSLIEDLCEFVGDLVGDPEMAEDLDGPAQEAFYGWVDDLLDEATLDAPILKSFKDYVREASTVEEAPVVASSQVTVESLLQEFTGKGAGVFSKDVAFVNAMNDSLNGKTIFVDFLDGPVVKGYKLSSAQSASTVAGFKDGEQILGDPMDDLDEARLGSDHWRRERERKESQYGEPFYLNTDCGYASLNDIATHEYFGTDGGVVVLEIDRNGKKGLNYVAGYDSTPVGTNVTVITSTSNGDKFRRGKVMGSFTMDQYHQDRPAVEEMMAKLGVSPSKKLSVKTFD